MIKFEYTEIMNFDNAFRGMRNPLNSWEKSESVYCLPNLCPTCDKCGCKYNENIEWTPFLLGDNDIELAHKLIKGGTEHRKFLRQIFVSVDITAPLYWWKQFDTYKIGTTSNSTSTMHKIDSKVFTLEDFSNDDMSKYGIEILKESIVELNVIRSMFLETKEKKYWYDLIKLLPDSYNQKRTITMNYENLLSICSQRKGHKLKEWNDFRQWAISLPYSKDLIFYKELNNDNK